MLSQPGKNRLNTLCPCQAIDDPAAPQQQGDRYAAYFEAGRQCRILLGIDLHHCRRAGNPFGNCSHRRCE